MSLFYVDNNGDAGTALLLHSGHYGSAFITITATGTTQDMVDWQLVGLMECFDHHSKRLDRAIGLVWDESRTLIDFDGVERLTDDEIGALQVAGFNLFSFVPGSLDNSASFQDDMDVAEAAEDFDAAGFIIDYEAGALDEDDVIDGFQHLLDSGLVWQLQGSYQRRAQAYLNAGLIHHTRTRWGD